MIAEIGTPEIYARLDERDHGIGPDVDMIDYEDSMIALYRSENGERS